MRNQSIMRVIVLGVLAIIGIIGVQSYLVLNTWNLNERDFNRKVNYALYEVACALAEINAADLPTRNIIKRRSSNYYVVNIDTEIDANLLQYFLQRELEKLALNLDFEFGIYDCTTDQMVYIDYLSYSPEKEQQAATGQLPKYQGLNYYFGVRFPNRGSYLLGRMQLSIVFSAILFLTAVFFAYSMYVILRQKRLSEMQKDFINNMTHEFKTPLSTIKISADVFLQDEYIRQDQRLSRYAGIVQEQNQRLTSQVERILNIARFERGNFKLQRKPIDLPRTIRELIATEEMRLQATGGKIRFQDAAAPCSVLADPFHLENILYSLVDNAIKYCREQPDIRIGLRQGGRYAHLYIADNGIGIPREQQKRIFHKFYRVPTGNIHNVKGFGLGLYYVRKICQAHGWQIHLQSEVGKGTRFCIKMPLVKT